MTPASTSQPESRYWPRRYTTMALCFCAIFVCYIDRMNISVTIIPMAEDYGWSPSQRGFVLSSFYFGYMLTQVLGGSLADRFGGKIVLGLGVLIWSLFTLLTPLAAASGFAILIICRIFMGLGEGVTFPSIYSLTTRWMPPNERSRAIGLAQSGIPTGTVFALVATPIIAANWGWEWAFYSFSAVGLVWFVIWQWKVSTSPQSHPTISKDELALIESGAAEQLDGATRVPWKEFAKSGPVWAILVGFACGNWSSFVLFAWLPTFVNEGLGVEFESIGIFAMMPHVASFVSMNIFGIIGDRMLASGISTTRVRKTMSTIAFGGVIVSLLLVTHAESAWGAIAILTAGNMIGGANVAGFSANPMDISPKHAGSLAGLGNSIGTLPAIFGIYISGWILELTGSWPLFFYTTAGVGLFGLVFFQIFASGEKQFD